MKFHYEWYNSNNYANTYYPNKFHYKLILISYIYIYPTITLIPHKYHFLFYPRYPVTLVIFRLSSQRNRDHVGQCVDADVTMDDDDCYS